jgi:hypothetical protein
MSSIGSFTVDDGVHAYGVHRQVTFEGDQVVTKLTSDVEPLLEAAKAERIATAGNRWGEGVGTKVGTMPMAVYAEFMKVKSAEERQKFILKWLRENPAFVTFDKFLK